MFDPEPCACACHTLTIIGHVVRPGATVPFTLKSNFCPVQWRREAGRRASPLRRAPGDISPGQVGHLLRL